MRYPSAAIVSLQAIARCGRVSRTGPLSQKLEFTAVALRFEFAAWSGQTSLKSWCEDRLLLNRVFMVSFAEVQTGSLI